MEEQEKIYAENYIDELIIEKTEEKYLHGKPNDKYGIEFENSIITKSCVNLCLRSINDPNIYTKEYRHFAGIKLLLVKNNYEKKEDISDYITNLLDNGKYKVIPYSNYYYKIKFRHIQFYISFSGNDLIMKNYYYKDMDPFFYIEHEQALSKSITSYSDSYLGTYRLFKDKKKYLDLIIYSSEAEVDGFFEVLNKIELSSFKAPIAYLNYPEQFIKENSLLLYEIKSGNNSKDLIKQIQKRCHFICNYLNFFYKRAIYYFGFYKEKMSINYEINLEKSESSKRNGDSGVKDTEESSQNKNMEVNKEDFLKGKNNKQNDIKDDKEQKEDNKEEDGEEGKKKKEDGEEQNEILIKEKSNDKKISIFSQNQKIVKAFIDEDFSCLDNLGANIVIFALNDEIFGEKLKYEKEELNLLESLRDDVKTIKNKIDSMDIILREMAKKIGINPDDIQNKIK